LFNAKGIDNKLGIAIGNLATGKGAAVDEAFLSYVDYTPGHWYHMKVELHRVSGANQRMCFTITDDSDPSYEKRLMFPFPSGLTITTFTNIYFSVTRTGNNANWTGQLANLGINVVGTAVEPTSATITSDDDEIGPTGSTNLSAALLPWSSVNNHNITWSVSPAELATVTPGSQSWNATITGLNAGTGTVTVTATSAGTPTVKATKVITIKDIKLSTVNISGPSTVSQGNTITLTADVAPLSASNTNVVWSSSNTDVATVNSSTGVVTGVSPGTEPLP